MEVIPRKFYYLIVLIVFIFTSCEDNSVSDVLIFISPAESVISSSPNEVVAMQVNISAINGLSNFKIYQKDQFGFRNLVKEVSLNGEKKFNYYYEFLTPEIYYKTSYLIEFEGLDVNGNTGIVARQIISNPKTKLLEMTSGHRFYSLISNNPNSYNIRNGISKVLNLNDSIEIDITDNSVDSMLSRTWTSPAKGSFVLSNGFDYANATNITLFNSFVAGNKLVKVNNLQKNDIIIYKLIVNDVPFYAAIRIDNVVDFAGAENDYYEFSIKK